jgi:hypothetical protein
MIALPGLIVAFYPRQRSLDLNRGPFASTARGRIPASFKDAAIARKLGMPEFRSASIVGTMSAALAIARAASTAVPGALAAAVSKTRFPSLLRTRAPQISVLEL